MIALVCFVWSVLISPFKSDSRLEAENVAVPTANPIRLTRRPNRVILSAMGDLCKLIWYVVAGLFRSRAALHAEVLVLRHQLNVLRRKSPKRLVFNNIDRLVFAGLCSLAPNVVDALKILKPETVVRWHRAGFRAYWRWKSRPRGGRPRASAEVRELIREMSLANPLLDEHGQPAVGCAADPW
jgi:hypothetical protein